MKRIEDTPVIRGLLLDMLKFVDMICKENNIDYSLTGGTLLGAVRHGGFIPWDDDIDIFMPRKSYEKFIEIFNEKSRDYSSRYCCLTNNNDRDYYYCFAKVVDKTTFAVESNCMPIEAMGLYIDVFPMDKISDDVKTQLKAVKAYKRYNRCLYYSIKEISSVRKKHMKLFSAICKICGWKHWQNKVLSVIEKYRCDESSRHSINFCGCYGMREIVSSDYFKEYTSLEFEGHEFKALKEYDKYLKNVYGDYMQLPPVECRVNKHNLKVYLRDEQDEI